jgi:hypothetical protein
MREALYDLTHGDLWGGVVLLGLALGVLYAACGGPGSRGVRELMGGGNDDAPGR